MRRGVSLGSSGTLVHVRSERRGERNLAIFNRSDGTGVLSLGTSFSTAENYNDIYQLYNTQTLITKKRCILITETGRGSSNLWRSRSIFCLILIYASVSYQMLFLPDQKLLLLENIGY